MPREKADFVWYSAESQKRKLPPRCPIASGDLCPRYYWSLEALTKSGFTEIPREMSAKLARKWEMFEASMDEDKPWVSYQHDREDESDRALPLQTVSHFCPEVSYGRFGYFASDLIAYCGADSDERAEHMEYDERLYSGEGIGEQFDPEWQKVSPQHYTECREYSIHGTFAAAEPSRAAGRRGGISPKKRWHVLARDSFTCVYCGRKPPEVALHADHKVSVKDGGSDELDNLVTACDECNGGKGKASI
ncbi:MAG TPA: HNH endonuclease [Terriglobia bacterium]|nr:HNH endonuclease [Terriglobia bacterium]